MKQLVEQVRLSEILIANQNFSYLFEKHENYYKNQIRDINSDLINDMAKVLLSQYRLKYYIVFNSLIENNDDRDEYDFYNMNYFDSFLETAKNNIRVYSENDLHILNSILDLSNTFLKNAMERNNFDSLLNSFYKLKDKLESNHFVLKNDKSLRMKQVVEYNLYEKEMKIRNKVIL